jgi:putative flippase GtrA
MAGSRIEWRDELRRSAKFVVVGAFAAGASYGAFTLVIVLGTYYLLAAGFAYGVGVLISFILNAVYTFAKPPRGSRLAKFTFVHLALMGGGMVLLALLVERIGLAPLLAQAITLALRVPLSYLANRTWVFGSQREAVPAPSADAPAG